MKKVGILIINKKKKVKKMNRILKEMIENLYKDIRINGELLDSELLI